MLVHLAVHNYAIVEHLDLELHTGMSVITGETGAGRAVERAQALQAGGQGGQHVAAVVLAALLQHQAAGAEQAFGIGQNFVLLLQLRQLIVTEGQVVEFLKLVAE